MAEVQKFEKIVTRAGYKATFSKQEEDSEWVTPKKYSFSNGVASKVQEKRKGQKSEKKVANATGKSKISEKLTAKVTKSGTQLIRKGFGSRVYGKPPSILENLDVQSQSSQYLGNSENEKYSDKSIYGKFSPLILFNDDCDENEEAFTVPVAKTVEKKVCSKVVVVPNESGKVRSGVQSPVESRKKVESGLKFVAAEPLPSSNTFIRKYRDVNVLDLNGGKFGEFLVAAVKAKKGLPMEYITRISNIHCIMMSNVIEVEDKGRCEETRTRAWKKLYLLPLILHANVPKVELKRRLEMLEKGEFDVKLKDLIESGVKKQKDGGRGAGKKKKRSSVKITEAFRNYNVSKAMQLLENEGKAQVNVNFSVYNQLVEKFPYVSALREDYEAEFNIKRFKVEDEGRIVIQPKEVKMIVDKMKKMVRAGMDQWTHEHLKILVGNHFGAQTKGEQRFLEKFTKIIELVANGSFPEEIGYLIKDFELIAIPKDEVGEDVRPISIGAMWRKIAGKICYQRVAEFNLRHFGNFQYGLKKYGMEKVIHGCKINREKHPDWDFYVIDGVNAFNTANRIKGLDQVMQYCPKLLPFLREMYLYDSNGWLYGSVDFIKYVVSSTGYHQGDVLSSWLYCMTTLPLINLIDGILKKEFGDDCCYVQTWYIDDGNVLAPRNIMVRVIELLREYGPRYGFTINFKKGAYLFGDCDSKEEVESLKGKLTQQFGFPEEIFKSKFDDEEYGTKVLGSYIGSDAYVKNQLMKYFDKLVKVSEIISGHDNIQERWLLFTRSFLAKPLHVLKTISPRLTSNFVTAFENLKVSVMKTMMGLDELSILDSRIMNVPIDEGGLGLGDYRVISIAAYISSLQESIMQEVNGEGLVSQGEYTDQVLDFEECIGTAWGVGSERYEEQVDVRSTNVLFRRIRELTGKEREKDTTTQHYITGFMVSKEVNSVNELVKNSEYAGHYHWFMSLKNKQAGKWLEAMPTHDRLVMSSDDFAGQLRYRMFGKFKGRGDQLVCKCIHKVPLDRHGDHLATGCGLTTGRHDIHDSIKFDLKEVLKYFDYKVEVERRDQFGDSEMRPDLVVYDYKGNAKKLLLDVTIPSTMHYHIRGDVDLGKCNGMSGKSAAAAFKLKEDKYKELAKQHNHLFLPFVVESCGVYHPEALKFLSELSKQKEKGLQCRPDTVLNYILKWLSVSLQSSIARAMQMKYNYVTRDAKSVCMISDQKIYDNTSQE